VFSLEHCASKRSFATNFHLFPNRWAKKFETDEYDVFVSKDTFDPIQISTVFILKSEPCSLECSLEAFHAVNEKHGIANVVFFARLSE
jgi:hypothetical protein